MELNDFNFSLEVEKKSLLPTHEPYRLKAGVENQSACFFQIERREAVLFGMRGLEDTTPCRRGNVLARDSSAPPLIMVLKIGKFQGPVL